ncbi:cysteine synthase [Parvularcula bermudensis HTCC2503]|uniref:Cysteine synthase n=1 Tax=Parvularcula bermudensis (strain ATCC BAA-594 / HTCC2503 / KCTC 12087) TaxID=314260 RepID=E0TDW5_PARBH|nr:cysteine synthase A [Parvularcula bermudensis]ADM10414.1 cysteine synthase [Parvularcula bermudensis HTCC2503]
MQTHPSVLSLIGNTPLLKLRRASEETGCLILGKCEFLNPGQSVKDRAALSIVEAAEAAGTLKPGGTIVEGTAGNTGIGLCLVGKAKGYKVKIVMPRTQSAEKKDAIRLLGGELIEVDAVPYANPANYIHQSKRIAAETENAVWANQFDNTANRDAHIRTTGPEIWTQTDGTVDGFCCAVGSGGTLAGVSMALKERGDVKIAAADPEGAKIYSWIKTGELAGDGSSVMEGIGQGRVTANLDGAQFDDAYRIPDDEALQIVFSLMEEEGLCLGGSSGINIAGAKRLAKDLGPGSTVVTILCDYGNRYQSKLFNPEFLQSKGLPVPPWMS